MRAGLMAAAVAAVLSVTGGASHAAEGDPAVVVADRPGAPRDMAQQLEKLTGRWLGDLEKVMALETGGRSLTAEQVDKIVAGGEVDGVKLLGVLPGSREILDTTMFDLSDGRYDGPVSGVSATTGLVFIHSVPGREWCLTMCMSTGRTLQECVMLKYVYG